MMLHCELCKELSPSLHLVVLGKKVNQAYVCKDCIDRLHEVKEQLTKESD